MRLPALAVRRPVATTMLFLAVALLGVVSFRRLEVSLLPPVRSEAVQVWVAWPAAGVPEIEEAVARPVEEAVLAATGVRRVRTRVVSGGASFRVELHPGVDPGLATVGLREKLDAVRWSFPPGVERPLVLGGAGEEAPVLVLAIASPDLPGVAEWAETVLAPRLEQLDGVARATVVGAPRPEITVLPDEDRLRGAGLSVADVASALRAANVESPGGALRQRGIRYALRVESRLTDAGDVADVVIAPAGAPPVRLGDVARITDGFAEPEGFTRLDGEPAVGVLVWRQAGRNLLKVTGLVREELARIEDDYGFGVTIVADSSPFVRQAVSGVGQALALGGLLAFGVLFGFLRDGRSPLLLAVALPISVVVTFLALDLVGVSLNLMSLAGLALGIGMLVDNGIVCLENIHRLRRDGLDPSAAAARGAREIAMPVLASTLTTCAVFAPLAFLPGAIGTLCRDLAIAISVSLFISWIVAMTLLPILAARFPGRVRREPPMPLHGMYQRILGWALAHPASAMLAAVAVVAGSTVALAGRPREVLPDVRTDHLEVALRLPAGVDVSATDGTSRRIEAWLSARSEVEGTFSTVGDTGALDPGDDSRRPNRATLRVRLAGSGRADRAALTRDLLAEFAGDDGLALEVVPDAPELAAVMGGGGATLTLDLAGPDERRSEEAARSIAERAAELAGVDRTALRVVAAEREPRLRLRPREEAAWRYGVREEELIPAIEAITSGHEATRILRFDEEVPVVVRLPVTDPRQARIMAGGRVFPVDELFETGTELAPATLLREDQVRVASIRWDGPLRDADGVRRALEEALAGTALPAGTSARFGGAWREMRGTLAALGRAVALSAGLVLLVLAAQFESIRLPLLVFTAVPLAGPGVALALWLTDGALGVMAGVGLVVLVGIAVNDAILKVDLFRRFHAEGLPARECVLRASRLRYRPIVMTTVTTVLGLVPLFLGRGAELRAPMAAVVIGGLTSATLLTLVLLPVLFERLVAHGRAPVAVPVPVLAGERA